MAVMLKRYRFTVEEYERLAEAQVLTQCDRVELLDGEIVEMSPIGDRHASVVSRLTHLLWNRLGERSIVWIQNPLRLRAVRSMPHPDVVLLRSRADFTPPASLDPMTCCSSSRSWTHRQRRTGG